MVASTLFASGSHAQSPPDAGTLLQQLERERAPAAQPPLSRPAEPETSPPASGPNVTVKRFRFVGNTLLPDAVLSLVVARFEERELDFPSLQAASTAVADRYREAGWVVRTLLPPQEISNGFVTIEIIESRFGTVRLEAPAPDGFPTARVLRIVQTQQPSGEPVRTAAIDRTLLPAGDLPGTGVTGALAQGQQPGETDLLLRVAATARFTGNALVDNTSAQATGAQRLTLILNVNGAFDAGDQLAVQAMHARGIDYVRLGFTVPVGFDGWRIGLNGSRLGYRVVLPEFAALGARGAVQSGGLRRATRCCDPRMPTFS